MIKNLLVLAVSTLVALAAGEVAVRALLKDQTVMFPRHHTDYRYGQYALRGIRANAEFRHSSVDGSWTFVTNSRGFRDRRDFDYAKPAGTLRVLSLGDSHTQGYEVRQEATFSAVLERALARGGLRAEVLNAGVSGYSTAEALAFLENEGHKFRPDVVVLGFYANDFEDNLKAGLFALDQGRLVERKFEHLPGVKLQKAIYAIPGVQWLGENSYLYSVAFNGVWVYFKRARLAGGWRGRVRRGGNCAPGGAGGARHGPDRAHARLLRAPRDPPDRGRHPAPRAFSWHTRIAAARAGCRGSSRWGSVELLAEYNGVAEPHVAHGHHHISEFTHALIGAELGRRIASRQSNPTAATSAVRTGMKNRAE